MLANAIEMKEEIDQTEQFDEFDEDTDISVVGYLMKLLLKEQSIFSEQSIKSLKAATGTTSTLLSDFYSVIF
jgi:hypothetical protein